MTRLPFATGGPIGERASLGLIALSTDETVEAELRAMLDHPGVALYTTRVPSDPDITPETLARMADALPSAAQLLPATLDYAAVAYACTSGTSVIGAPEVARLVRSGVETRHVTTPLDAVIEACAALGVRRIGFITPYAPTVTARLRARLEEAGLSIAAFGSFEQIEERVIARIDRASIVAAARAVAAQAPPDAPCEALFLSCTNLRCLAALPEIEAAAGLPALSSNQVLGWRLASAAGVALDPAICGRLAAARPASGQVQSLFPGAVRR